jgi:hypothetical protein
VWSLTSQLSMMRVIGPSPTGQDSDDASTIIPT